MMYLIFLWKKSVCTVHLLSKKVVKSFAKVREEEITAMMDKVEKGNTSTMPINLSEILFDLSNNVICRIAMGRKYRGEKNTYGFWK